MDNAYNDLTDLIVTGNAKDGDEQNLGSGWFIGHFIEPTYSLKCTQELEVKWGIHKANEEKLSHGVNKKATSLAILINGLFVFNFSDLDKVVTLKSSGDYVIYGPTVSHTWKAIEDSVVLTVRWPSILGDQIKL